MEEILGAVITTEKFRNSPINSIEDKFFFIPGADDFEKEARAMLLFISGIHRRYSNTRYCVWVGNLPEKINGNYRLGSINISADTTFKLKTFVHEVGHCFDQTELANSKSEVSPIYQEYRNLHKVLNESNSVNELRLLLNESDLDKNILSDCTENLLPEELFARCYEQYIEKKLAKHMKVSRVGNEHIFTPDKYLDLAQVYCQQFFEGCEGSESSSLFNLYWGDEEFQTLFIAMDNLIEKINQVGF